MQIGAAITLRIKFLGKKRKLDGVLGNANVFHIWSTSNGPRNASSSRFDQYAKLDILKYIDLFHMLVDLCF